MTQTKLEDLAMLLGVDEVRSTHSAKFTTLGIRVRGWWSNVRIPTAVFEDDATVRSGMRLWDEIQMVCQALRARAEIAEWLSPREAQWSPYP